MSNRCLLTATLAAAGLLAGCTTYPPGAERGPHGTMAYDVIVEASEPGVRIEANGLNVGTTPVHVKIFGDTDGTFHDFGTHQYVLRALPLTTNQFVQVRAFGTGGYTPEDLIPARVYFDMNQRPPADVPVGPSAYVYPSYGPPTFYYGPPYYGPSYRYYFGPRGYRRW